MRANSPIQQGVDGSILMVKRWNAIGRYAGGLFLRGGDSVRKIRILKCDYKIINKARNRLPHSFIIVEVLGILLSADLIR